MWWIVILVGIGAVLICVYNIPIPVDRTTTALEIKTNNEDHLVTREVCIEGMYEFNLIGKDVFHGIIKVSGYEYATGEYSMKDIEIDKAGDGPNQIRYELKTSMQSSDDTFLFGHFAADSYLRNAVIIVYEHKDGDLDSGNISGANATIIVLGAKDRHEALRKAESAFP